MKRINSADSVMIGEYNLSELAENAMAGGWKAYLPGGVNHGDSQGGGSGDASGGGDGDSSGGSDGASGDGWGW